MGVESCRINGALKALNRVVSGDVICYVLNSGMKLLPFGAIGRHVAELNWSNYSLTVCRTACSHSCIKAVARSALSVGKNVRSARHRCDSSAVPLYTPLEMPAK